jgi:zinc transport system ATP-binding protein
VSAPLLRCEGLQVGYAGRAILPPFSLEVTAGQFWAVIGRNGAGKSTFFKTLLGLLPPVGGRLERAPGLKVAYIAQRMAFDDLYPVTAREVVAMGRARRLWSTPGADPKVEQALARLEVAELADRTFRSLSEGQKQRVLLARMVASEAALAVLDEPTAAMDAIAERAAMALIDQLRRELHMAVLVVSHHLDEPRRRADRALFLDPDCERIVEGTTDQVFADPHFHHRYGDEFSPAEAHDHAHEHAHAHGGSP